MGEIKACLLEDSLISMLARPAQGQMVGAIRISEQVWHSGKNTILEVRRALG